MGVCSFSGIFLSLRFYLHSRRAPLGFDTLSQGIVFNSTRCLLFLKMTRTKKELSLPVKLQCKLIFFTQQWLIANYPFENKSRLLQADAVYDNEQLDHLFKIEVFNISGQRVR